jgi:Ser/Thr protein kinase RdoA (MazF antagonist)
MSIEHLLRESQSPAPDFTPESAARVAREHFGIQGECRSLAGERDLNFCLQGLDGSRHLLKIWNHAQDPAVIDFLIGALRHLELSAPGIPVPRIVRTLKGERRATVAGRAEHAVCLMTWLEGESLRDTPATPALFESLGSSLAHLDRALSDFVHAASHRDMLWDVSKAHRLRVLLPAVSDATTARLADTLLDQFETRILPGLASLPSQVLHADFNLDNVLVRPPPESAVCGVIDFGDALCAPRVCDLAIASAYHLSAGSNPLAHVRRLVTAYHNSLELEEAELRRLPGLIGARLVSSVLITSHMASLHPENRDYLLIDTRAAAAKLERLLDHDPEALADDLVRACEQPARRDPINGGDGARSPTGTRSG